MFEGGGGGGARERQKAGEQDLFRSRLDRIIDLTHALVKLSRAIDWRFLEMQFGSVYSDGPGCPPLPTRLMAGLALLKHMYDLSDEALCDRWIENPYFQFFCGEEFFQHRLPFDRSSLTRWRQRMGEAKLTALVQESLSVATRTEAMKPKDLARVVVDTTVQPKAVMFPTDAKLLNRARERLVRLAAHVGVELRQSYARVGKLALIKHQRYAHAHQFKRANRSLRRLKTYLGRVIRDIGRRIDGDPELEEIFARPLSLSRRVLAQDQRQRGPKVYSLHAPEVECIGKGKAHRLYEFGVKVSVATTAHRSKGGQFVTHVAALPGNPYDGHTLRRRGSRKPLMASHAAISAGCAELRGSSRAPLGGCACPQGPEPVLEIAVPSTGGPARALRSTVHPTAGPTPHGCLPARSAAARSGSAAGCLSQICKPALQVSLTP